MKTYLLCFLTLAWFVRSSCAIAPVTSLPPKPGKASSTNIASTLLIGGIGGAYFLAEPGELVVQVEKRDTLNIGIPHLDKFAYLGIYSSGIFGIAGRPGGSQPQASFEDNQQAKLDDAKLKEGFKLLWFATGKDDFLVATSRATVEMFKKHKFDVIYHETEGAHTWDNWREYLRAFAPLLFQ